MPRTEDWFEEPDLEPTSEPWDFPLERQHKRKRVATSAIFVTLFFAGAAFTAGAGNLVANKVQGGDPCAQQANTPTAADQQACDASGTSDGAAGDPTQPSDGAAPVDPAAQDASSAPAPDSTSAAPADPSSADGVDQLRAARSHASGEPSHRRLRRSAGSRRESRRRRLGAGPGRPACGWRPPVETSDERRAAKAFAAAGVARCRPRRMGRR